MAQDRESLVTPLSLLMAKAIVEAPRPGCVPVYGFMPPDPLAERVNYELAFSSWAASTAAEWALAFPDAPPFDVARFDGCTFAPDDCRDCCLIHDLGCHYAISRPDRRVADDFFRRCIMAKSAYEGPLWAWLWPVRARIFWLAVSVYGFLSFRPRKGV